MKEMFAVLAVVVLATEVDGEPDLLPASWESTEVVWLESTGRHLGLLLESPSKRWVCFDVEGRREGAGTRLSTTMAKDVVPFQDCLKRGEAVHSAASPRDGGTNLELVSETVDLRAIPVAAMPEPCSQAFEALVDDSRIEDPPRVPVRSLHLEVQALRLTLGDGTSICWHRSDIRNVSPTHLAAFVQVVGGWMGRGGAVSAKIERSSEDGGARRRTQFLNLFRSDDERVDASFEFRSNGYDCS